MLIFDAFVSVPGDFLALFSFSNMLFFVFLCVPCLHENSFFTCLLDLPTLASLWNEGHDPRRMQTQPQCFLLLSEHRLQAVRNTPKNSLMMSKLFFAIMLILILANSVCARLWQQEADPKQSSSSISDAQSADHRSRRQASQFEMAAFRWFMTNNGCCKSLDWWQCKMALLKWTRVCRHVASWCSSSRLAWYSVFWISRRCLFPRNVSLHRTTTAVTMQ